MVPNVICAAAPNIGLRLCLQVPLQFLVDVRRKNFFWKCCEIVSVIGTGAFGSTVDCHSSLKQYVAASLHSGDGVFLDDVDPLWIFLQRERKQKSALYMDFPGKQQRQSNVRNAPAAHECKDMQSSFLQQRFSDRLGVCLPNSPQALTRHKWEVCEASMVGNLGPPTAMTTLVANVHTGPIVQHVDKGPFVAPDPEKTFEHLTKRPKFSPVTQHAAIVQKDFMRRCAYAESVMYQRDHDARRGRQQAVSRRREHQKRGPGHCHYNEYGEPCRKRPKRVHVPMHRDFGGRIHIGVVDAYCIAGPVIHAMWVAPRGAKF